MSDSKKIKSGFFWLTSGTLAQAFSKVLITALLSRLLGSEVFGVVTIASTLVGTAELFTQISLGKSLVQKVEVRAEHIETAFTFSLAVGVVLFAGFVLGINSIVASYFKYPDLKEVLDVLAWLFPVRAFSQVSFALLQRKKDFKSLAGLEAISYIIGYGVVATILAYFDFGVWSLVYGSIVISVVYSTLLYSKAKFRLSIGFNRVAFNELFSFGTTYSLIKIVNFGALKGDYLVVGKVLGAGALGVYSRAYTLMDSVNSILGKVLYTLMFPFFAGNADSSGEKTLLKLKIIAITINVILPLSVLSFIYADYIIQILLGSNWTEAILVFRILSVSMLARVGYKVVSSFLLSAETINSNLLVQTIYFVMIVAGVYAGSRFFSLVGASVAVTFTLYFIFFLFVRFLLKADVEITPIAIMGTGSRGFLLSLVLGPTNYFFKQLVELVQLSLFFKCSVLILINVALLALLFAVRNRLFFEDSIISLFNKLVGRVNVFKKVGTVN